MAKKILLSGIQPSGFSHIGNYFGAMKQFVELQSQYDCYIFIADLHALTTIQDKEVLEEYTGRILLDYLAIGLDPKQVTIYKQSDLPQVAELAWIFNCLTSVSYLERAHAYKDAIASGKEATVGLFSYPLLMAADILIQDASLVPTGLDQKQHIEITRDTAQRFNNIFGEIFKLPEPFIPQNVAVVPGTDGRKMSKSYGNTIPLFGPNQEIEKMVMSIVTDSGSDIPKNVYEIHKLFKQEDELQKLYYEKRGKYKELKEELIKDIQQFNKVLIQHRAEWRSRSEEVRKILADGGEKARERAEKKMEKVRKLVGLKLY